MRNHDQAVQDQFDAQAQAYLLSAVHAAGPDLIAARDRVCALGPDVAQVLDVGTGAGHLSFALAACAARVVALDPSPGMLATVRATAAARALPQIHTCEASATALPFADASFDLVCSRYSAHHWSDLPRGLQEMRRVCRPHGHVLVIDVQGEEQPLADSHLQAMELLRDPSHVRNRSGSEWQSLLRAARFAVLEHCTFRTRLEFSSWVARMRTPEVMIQAIRQLQRGAPSEVHEALEMGTDGSFTVTTGMLWAQAQ